MKGDGIKIMSHDLGRVLVQSRTERDVYHLTDIQGQECSCAGYSIRCYKDRNFKCWHLKFINHLLGIKLNENN